MNTFLKIVTAFVAVSLLNILPGLVRLDSTRQVEEYLDLFLHSSLDEHEGISQLSYHLQRAKSNIRELLLESSYKSNTQEMVNAVEVVNHSLSKMKEAVVVLQSATHKGDEAESLGDSRDSGVEVDHVKEIAAGVDTFIKDAREIASVIDTPEDVKFYLALFMNSLEPSSRVLQGQIEEFKEDEFKEVQEELEAIHDKSHRIHSLVITLSIISFVLSLLIGILFAKRCCSQKTNNE